MINHTREDLRNEMIKKVASMSADDVQSKRKREVILHLFLYIIPITICATLYLINRHPQAFLLIGGLSMFFWYGAAQTGVFAQYKNIDQGKCEEALDILTKHEELSVVSAKIKEMDRQLCVKELGELVWFDMRMKEVIEAENAKEKCSQLYGVSQ